MSIAGGIDLAVDRLAEMGGGQAMQIFTQSPRRWQPTEREAERLARFRRRRRETGVDYVLCHGVYLINLATADRRLHERSRRALLATVDVAGELRADVCLHVGSHAGRGVEAALDRIARALEPALDRLSGRSHLLLENCAGGGGTVGRSIAELETIIDRLAGHRRLGICLDTCHLWATGVDITRPDAVEALVADVRQRVGLRRVRALHVNDTPDQLGSNRDVHANIGQGRMRDGLAALLGHAAFSGLPAILETPGRDGRGPDATELRRLKALCRRSSTRRIPRSGT